ncbi:MAG: hypothetical protein ACHQ6U_06330 [Thermodesulfobacteriota bacterium]
MRLIYALFFAGLACFGFSGASSAQQGDISLESLVGSKHVLIIGESYGRPESERFFAKAVSDYLNRGGCLKVGLEISSDQQTVLDSAMKGAVPVSQVKINDILNSGAYRQMLTDLSTQVKAGKCLSVHAIDAPGSVLVTRDAWMEKEVVQLIGDTPVVLLVGNVRAVKSSGNGDSGKLLTERLGESAVDVISVMQNWRPGQCENKSVEYIKASDEKAVVYLKETVGKASENMPGQPTAIADGVLVWSCNSENISENIDITNNSGGEKVSDKINVTDKKTEVVVRDEKVLKKIRWGIKNNYPAVGMTKDEALRAMGEPSKKMKADNVEKWSYECFDEKGYWHNCFELDFKDDVVYKFSDLE